MVKVSELDSATASVRRQLEGASESCVSGWRLRALLVGAEQAHNVTVLASELLTVLETVIVAIPERSGTRDAAVRIAKPVRDKARAMGVVLKQQPCGCPALQCGCVEGDDALPPDVGDIVEYDGERWRVDSWLVGLPASRGTLRFKRDGLCFRWCRREEADHLSISGVCGAIVPVAISGVCGAIVPVAKCVVVDRVNWPEHRIAEQRDRALKLVGLHVW